MYCTGGNPLYVLHRWQSSMCTAQVAILYVYCTGGNEMPQSHTRQPFSMCHQRVAQQTLSIRREPMLSCESEKASSCQQLLQKHLACIASALPLSYDNWTTISLHNPLYVPAQTRCPGFNFWCLLAFSLPSILHKAKGHTSHLAQPLSLKTLPWHSSLCSCMYPQCHSDPLMS